MTSNDSSRAPTEKILDRVNQNIRCHRHLRGDSWALDDTTRQVDPADILRRISQSPPWAEPVAMFDEDLDTWTY